MFGAPFSFRKHEQLSMVVKDAAQETDCPGANPSFYLCDLGQWASDSLSLSTTFLPQLYNGGDTALYMLRLFKD